MSSSRESIYKSYIPQVNPEHEPGTPAYWFVFSEGRLLVEFIQEHAGEAARIPVAPSLKQWSIEPIRTHYLGTWQGVPCYAVEASEEADAPEGLAFHALRALYETMEEGLFHLAGRAIQIVAWARTHQFCGQCGGRTVKSEREHAMLCPTCGTSSYPRLAPAVIVAILKDKQVLLAHARHFRNNMYGLIAGFVEPGETLEDCVQREIREEIGLNVKNIRYFGSQQWPFPHSIMIGFIADYDSGEIRVDGEEIVDADWFDAEHLPEIPSRVSIARKMLDWYTEEYYPS